MDEYTKQLIEGARLAYRPILTGEDSRITRGTVLWDQFERAAGLCRTDAAAGERALAERIKIIRPGSDQCRHDCAHDLDVGVSQAAHNRDVLSRTIAQQVDDRTLEPHQ